MPDTLQVVAALVAVAVVVTAIAWLIRRSDGSEDKPDASTDIDDTQD